MRQDFAELSIAEPCRQEELRSARYQVPLTTAPMVCPTVGAKRHPLVRAFGAVNRRTTPVTAAAPPTPSAM